MQREQCGFGPAKVVEWGLIAVTRELTNHLMVLQIIDLLAYVLPNYRHNSHQHNRNTTVPLIIIVGQPWLGTLVLLLFPINGENVLTS